MNMFSGWETGFTGVFFVQYYYQHLIKVGRIPLLNPKEVATAKPINPKRHYANLKKRAVYAFITFLCSMVAIFGLPVLFYLFQRIAFYNSEMIMFNNVVWAILSFFPFLLFSMGISPFIKKIVVKISPFFKEMEAYVTIVTANSFYHNTRFQKVDWGRLITPKILSEYYKKDAEHVSRFSWLLIPTIPLIVTLFFLLFSNNPHSLYSFLLWNKRGICIEEYYKSKCGYRV